MTTSINLKVNGLDRGTLFTNIGASSSTKLVQAIQFDATAMPTGVYPYEATLTNHYTASTRSILEVGEALVNNLSDSIFGSGWSIEGLSKLYAQTDGGALIDEGDGDLLHFKARISTVTPPFTSGTQSGAALKFDGFNDYVNFPTGSGNLMKVSPLTVEAWIRPELRVELPDTFNISTTRTHHSHGVGNVTLVNGVIETGHGFGVNIFGGESTITITRVYGQQTTRNAPNNRKYITNPVLIPDIWYHLAVVYTNGNHKTYLNGQLIDDTSYPQGLVTYGNGRLTMGVMSDPNEEFFSLEHYKGYLDEVRIWHAARTEQEIQDKMHVQLSGNETGLVFYANFDEGQGQVLNDLIGGANGNLGSNTTADGNDPAWINYTEFDRDADGDFITPAGDYSLLLQNPDGTFTRKMKDGSVINFNAQGLQSSVVDRNGNTTTYQYNGQGRLTTITDPVGKVTTLTYSGDRLSSVTDPAGRTTTFEHDGAGNLIKITDPDGTFRQFSYDSNHRMTSQTSKRGHVTTYQYNFAGRNIGATRPDGSTVTLSPQWMSALINPATGLGTQTNPAPVVKPEDVKASYTDGNGKTTTYKLNDMGAILETTDALARKTVNVRDSNNNITKTTDPRNNVTVMTYDTKGNLLTSTEQSIGATTTFSYTTDGFNQVKTIKDPRNNTTTFNYDVKGNLTSVVDALSNQTTMTYNTRGLLLSSKDALNNTVTFEYDPVKGNLIGTTDQLLNETIFALDTAGNVIVRTDAEGKTTEFDYDSMNRLIQVADPDLAITVYGYDPAGNLASVTDARGKTTTFTYDTRNRLSGRADPLGNSESVTYDGNGNVISTTDRKGQTITFAYDAANQLTSKTLPGALITTYTYDKSGNRLTVYDPDSKLNMTYDGANRLKVVDNGSTPKQPFVKITYTYDLNGNVTAIEDLRVGSTTVTTYVYDALNRLTSLTNPASQTVSFTYDSISRRTKTTFPNGVTTDYTYDAKSQLTSLINKVGSTNISTFGYAYDGVGDRASMSTTRTGVTVNSPLSYSYDNLYRLTQATNPVPSQSLETFTYDAVGNRLRKTGQTTNSTFDNANRLIEDAEFTYVYDNNGNLISKTNKATSQVTTYIYDAENQLTQVNKTGMSATYSYDGLGRRIEKNVNGVKTRYVYNGEDILREYDLGANLLARYTHGPGIDEALIMERGGQSYFYYTDGLGSKTELVNSTGTVSNSFVYDSFGNIASQNGSVINPYTYTGREFDSESGLYYYRARYYEAMIGRFLQEDPIPGAIAIPQSLNPYPYVQNNPLNFVDPFGLSPECREKAWQFFKYCQSRGGLVTGFSTGGYVAACGLMGVFGGGGPIIPCVAAVGKIGTLVGVVWGAVCYFEYRDQLDRCCKDDKECGPKLGPFPIPVPPDCGLCNFDIKR